MECCKENDFIWYHPYTCTEDVLTIRDLPITHDSKEYIVVNWYEFQSFEYELYEDAKYVLMYIKNGRHTIRPVHWILHNMPNFLFLFLSCKISWEDLLSSVLMPLPEGLDISSLTCLHYELVQYEDNNWIVQERMDMITEDELELCSAADKVQEQFVEPANEPMKLEEDIETSVVDNDYFDLQQDCAECVESEETNQDENKLKIDLEKIKHSEMIVNEFLKQNQVEEACKYIADTEFNVYEHYDMRKIYNKIIDFEIQGKTSAAPTDVQRHRAIKKLGYPRSIWDGNKLSYNFRKIDINVLKQFIDENPGYEPSMKIYKELSKKTQMTEEHIQIWFKNYRFRKVKK